jgi:hypothetical protein
MGRPSEKYNNYLWYSICGESKHHHTNISLAIFKIVWRFVWRFSEPGFPYNLAKNGRHDVQMGCIDASRRRLQSVPKIRV